MDWAEGFCGHRPFTFRAHVAGFSDDNSVATCRSTGYLKFSQREHAESFLEKYQKEYPEGAPLVFQDKEFVMGPVVKVIRTRRRVKKIYPRTAEGSGSEGHNP